MKNEPQMSFDTQSLARDVKPDPNRPEPQVWFQTIAILRSLEGCDGNEIRRIKLHKGLNILWAPPEDPSKKVRMYEDGLSGHASGKTLFCRILRYLLGEQNYGNDLMQKAVAKTFPELWALGEVMVNGQLWLAARPMTPNLHKFAIRGVTIDQYLRDLPARGNFDHYLGAVEEAVCGSLAGREEANELFRWRYVLPWLTRDQECRFAALTDWRSPLSEAERPQTSVAEQQLLIRAVLDLLDVQEQRLKLQLEQVEDDLKKDNESLPGAERQWKRDWKRLATQLQRLSIQPTEPEKRDELAQLESRASKFLEGVQDAIRLANEDKELQSAYAVWQAKHDEKSNLNGQIVQMRKDVQTEEGKWKEVSSKRQRLRERGIRNPARVEDGFCPHTLEHAIERGCVKAPEGMTIQSALELGNLQSENDVLKGIVEEKKVQLARAESAAERLELAVAEAQSKYQCEQERVQKTTAELRKREHDAEMAGTLFEEIKESFDTFSGTRARIEKTTTTREELKQQLEIMRQAHSTKEQFLSDLFADIIRAVMGSQVSARVSLGERGLSLKADRHGELYGAALETIKVLAFDIAALAASMESRGFHPRFLIHDGPREADMSRVIYERFFLYASKLEKGFPSGTDASFQYIITTTTPPPEHMQNDRRWILDPVLDGSKKEGRLLKADL